MKKVLILLLVVVLIIFVYAYAPQYTYRENIEGNTCLKYGGNDNNNYNICKEWQNPNPCIKWKKNQYNEYHCEKYKYETKKVITGKDRWGNNLYGASLIVNN